MNKRVFKKILIIIMTIIFLCVFVYSLLHIISWHKDNEHTEELVDEVLETIETEEVVLDDELQEVVKIDFDELRSKNSDIRGWIKVNGTNINYPFVQSKDNSYYLTHSFDKKYTDAGWIFLDYRNDIDELSKNTVIYGHARKDNSMFGTLKYSLKKDWYSNEENHYITTTTDNEELTWQVFSTYHIKTEDYYITTNFNSDNSFIEFEKTIKKRSVYNYNVQLDKDDYILTLSSCYSDNQKVVLHAKLIKREARIRE